jgi:hypothetical protein
MIDVKGATEWFNELWKQQKEANPNTDKLSFSILVAATAIVADSIDMLPGKQEGHIDSVKERFGRLLQQKYELVQREYGGMHLKQIKADD